MNVEIPSQSSQTSQRMQQGKMTQESSMERGRPMSSCMVEESCIVKAPIGKVWESFKEFSWEKMCPSSIRSCKFTSGNPLQIGSTYRLERLDGKVYTFMIVEISDVDRRYVFEMIDCDPLETFSSMLSTVKCCKITEDSSTMVSWNTMYSNDVTPDIIRSRKELMKSYFTDMKKMESQS